MRLAQTCLLTHRQAKANLQHFKDIFDRAFSFPLLNALLNAFLSAFLLKVLNTNGSDTF